MFPYRGFKTQGGMPEASLRKTMVKPNFWRFAVHARGEIYIVFDEGSDFQVENNQFRQPGPKIGKNLISKTYLFEHLVFKHPLYTPPWIPIKPYKTKCVFLPSTVKTRI